MRPRAVTGGTGGNGYLTCAGGRRSEADHAIRQAPSASVG